MNERDVLAKSIGLGPSPSPIRARGYRPPLPVPTAVESPSDLVQTPTRGRGYRPPLPTPTAVQSPAELNQSPDYPTRGLADVLGAAPFRRIPSMDSPQPSPAIGPSPMSTATPSVRNVAETERRGRMEQASTSQSSVGSDYRWATLNVSASIGGKTFPAGTRIAVAPSQTQTSGGGKAHTTSIVTKVWAKFGQTFDASSWLAGWLAASAFSYTGQSATWSNATGFGAIDVDEVKREAFAVGTFFFGLVVGAGVAATVTYLWLENESRTVYTDSRAYRYGKRPGS